MASSNSKGITAIGLLGRFVLALVVVMGTYNPSGHSYYHWALSGLSAFDIYKAFVGICLIIGWTMFARETYLALGRFGIILAAAFFGTLLWMVVKWGLVSPDSPQAMTYLILVGLAAILTAGAAWGHVRMAFSGQRSTDDVEN